MNKEVDNIFDDIFSDITKYTKDLTLLYVEDNKIARESSALVFKEFFKNIIVAVDGEDGFNKFQENSVDVIISDINMPKMDGVLMFDKIRQIDKKVHLILLTAHNEIEYYERSMTLNIDGYLHKPISIAPLLTILDKISLQFKLKDQLARNNKMLEQYQYVMDQNLIVSKTDLRGHITYINERFLDTYGYSKDEILGNSHSFLKSDKNPSNIYSDIWDTISVKKQAWTGLIGNKTKKGDISYSKTTISPILDIDDNPIEYIAIRQDVTDLIPE